MASAISPQEAAILAQLNADLARRDLLEFIHLVRPDYECNWHHELIAREVQDWATGQGPPLLIIETAPAHGKSEIVSRGAPAWLMATQPRARVIAVSHTQALATEMSQDVLEILRSQDCRRVFGEVVPRRSSVESWRTHSGGQYLCAGIGGPVAGKHMHFGFIDDPVKNPEEAYSPTIREKTWQWYSSVFRQRRIGQHARMLITSTRWHEDDLVGRIKLREPGRWRVVTLKALDETDKRRPKAARGALWPARYPREFLDEERRVNERGFEALYQQQPVAEGGGMFKRAWFRYARQSLSVPHMLEMAGEYRDTRNARRFLTVDLAVSTKESSDYTVIAAWASFAGGPLVLIGLMRQRLEGPDILPQVRLMMQRHGAGDAWIERMGFQASLIQDARRKGLAVRELHADKDKATRAAPAAALFSAGRLWFIDGMPGLIELEDELVRFAGANRQMHDDQVDVVAYAARVHDKMSDAASSRTALY